MRRRRFLENCGAAAFAAASGPFVQASDKTGEKPVVIGAGEHKYECHHGFGQLPDHLRWYETHNVAVDSQGLVYVTHRAGSDRAASPEQAMDTIVVFEPSGKFVRSFGKEWHGGGHGIDIREENGVEYLYLCMMFPINLIVKTTLSGEVVWVKDRSSVEPSGVYPNAEAKFSPTNIAFAPGGGFYIADGYGSNFIHQFDAKTNYVRTWGGTGTEPGKMRTPHGIWMDNRLAGKAPTLVVADRANARLQLFNLEGSLLSIVNDVLFPAHFDTRGDLLLVPDLHARLSLFDTDYKPIIHLGDDPDWITEVKKLEIRTDPTRWVSGKFVHPHDACFDAEGNIYVAEWVVPGRLTFLRHVS